MHTDSCENDEKTSQVVPPTAPPPAPPTATSSTTHRLTPQCTGPVSCCCCWWLWRGGGDLVLLHLTNLLTCQSGHMGAGRLGPGLSFLNLLPLENKHFPITQKIHLHLFTLFFKMLFNENDTDINLVTRGALSFKVATF